jgi:putative endonuclease
MAADHLVARGWTVLARNYRAGPKEIDLVVSRARVVAFVEVKTRATSSGGTLFEPIGSSKRRAVVAAARHWMHEYGRPGTIYRFDAIGVEVRDGRVSIEHIPDAWRPG